MCWRRCQTFSEQITARLLACVQTSTTPAKMRSKSSCWLLKHASKKMMCEFHTVKSIQLDTHYPMQLKFVLPFDCILIGFHFILAEIDAYPSSNVIQKWDKICIFDKNPVHSIRTVCVCACTLYREYEIMCRINSFNIGPAFACIFAFQCNLMLWSLFQKKIKACVVVHHNQIQLKAIFETISAVTLRSLFRFFTLMSKCKRVSQSYFTFFFFAFIIINCDDNNLHEGKRIIFFGGQTKKITTFSTYFAKEYKFHVGWLFFFSTKEKMIWKSIIILTFYKSNPLSRLTIFGAFHKVKRILKIHTKT